MSTMQRELAVDQIKQARNYTQELLDSIPETEWFKCPPGLQSNVAWQVAHLAMAEYRLGLERVRGHVPADDDLIPPRFLELYGKGSVPSADPNANFSFTDIRKIFQGVHSQLLAECSGWSDESLQEEVLKPHRLFTKKVDALWWCGRHEMLHAGQIGLLRRLLGQEPIW